MLYEVEGQEIFLEIRFIGNAREAIAIVSSTWLLKKDLNNDHTPTDMLTWVSSIDRVHKILCWKLLPLWKH